MIIDTSTYVLKRIPVANVAAANTSNNAISVSVPANVTLVPIAIETAGPIQEDIKPSVSYNSGNLYYKWNLTGSGRFAQLDVLAF